MAEKKSSKKPPAQSVIVDLDRLDKWLDEQIADLTQRAREAEKYARERAPARGLQVELTGVLNSRDLVVDAVWDGLWTLLGQLCYFQKESRQYRSAKRRLDALLKSTRTGIPPHATIESLRGILDAEQAGANRSAGAKGKHRTRVDKAKLRDAELDRLLKLWNWHRRSNRQGDVQRAMAQLEREVVSLISRRTTLTPDDVNPRTVSSSLNRIRKTPKRS